MERASSSHGSHVVWEPRNLALKKPEGKPETCDLSPRSLYTDVVLFSFLFFSKTLASEVSAGKKNVYFLLPPLPPPCDGGQ